MQKLRKYTLRTVLVILSLLLLLWIVLSGYFYFNKAGIVARINTQINKKIKGDIQIKNLDADFLHTFPFLSVHLTGVSIKDSLWAQHHHEFLKAENIYVRLALFSLFGSKPEINKVIIENGLVDYYTDIKGNSNLVRTEDSSGTKQKSKIPGIVLKNVRIVLHDDSKNKLHDVLAKQLECETDNAGDEKIFHIRMKAIVNRLAFNREKGAYLQGKTVEGKFRATLSANRELDIHNIVIKINNHPFTLDGKFYLNNEPKTFALTIDTKQIMFHDVSSLLTDVIRQKTDTFKIDKPIDVHADISGPMAYKTLPLVSIDMIVKNAGMQTPAGDFNDCSFKANLVNEIEKDKPRLDANSRFTITDFKGKWEKIPLTAKRIEVSNLVKPFLKCDLKSVFALNDINDITESNTIRFTKGLGNLNIQYAGSIAASDTIAPVMNGEIQLTDAVIHYIPRNFVLSNCDGKLLFKTHDLFIQKLNASAGNSRLLMNGSVINFLSLVDINPEKLVLDWNIYSPSLNVQDFIGYVGKRTAKNAAPKSGKRKIIRVTDNIDRMLKDGTANISLKADNLLYKRFKATEVSAAIALLTNRMVLDHAQLHHAGGIISFNGSLTEAVNNQLALNANLQNIDIPGIFYAFNNFGQDAVTDKNMRGNINAAIQLNAAIGDNAQVHSNSMQGLVSFSVKNGELINFEPVMKISQTAFKKRDFSRMRFAELKDKLYITGTAIRMDKMEIRSNVIKLFVEGVYDTKKGTDMSIQVPVTNISKDDHEILKNKGRAGLNVRLRAKTGDDGQLKVSWDPFNKAGKEREKIDSASKTN